MAKYPDEFYLRPSERSLSPASPSRPPIPAPALTTVAATVGVAVAGYRFPSRFCRGCLCDLPLRLPMRFTVAVTVVVTAAFTHVFRPCFPGSFRGSSPPVCWQGFYCSGSPALPAVCRCVCLQSLCGHILFFRCGMSFPPRY